MNSLSPYAERRVLSIMLARPELWPAGLESADFEYSFHSDIFDQIPSGEIAQMDISDEMKVFAYGLDENWTPENLQPFIDVIKRGAQMRRFAASMGKLRK